jgi:uncharacterized protein (TIGR03086 family)
MVSTEIFMSVLDQVGNDALEVPTPCEGWSAADLIWHVTRGSEMAMAIVNGASQAEASGLIHMTPEGDAVVQCCRALADQLTALNAVEDYGAIVHHSVGDIPIWQLFGFRIADLTLHAWDLARALGVELNLPEELAATVYEVFKPMEPFIGQSGFFGNGPSGSLPGGASTQERLLDLTGRRP